MPSRGVPSPTPSPVIPHTPIHPESPAPTRLHNPIILKPETPRYILIPQFDRPISQLSEPHHSTKAKHHKLIRHHKSQSREGLPVAPLLQEQTQTSIFSKFRVVQETKKISGFQCYAVEKWLVERDITAHPLTTVTGITNDPKDVVNVAVLAPPLSLSPAAAEEELQNVIYQLKRTGARPHETPDGVIMVTSFNSFRGDLNLVLIPDGDYDAHRCQLFTNINLARMGCGGRIAPTLDPAQESTQDKFLALYAIPNVALFVGFNNVVLEFVRLVQAALMIFGFFPTDPADRDGLLCDLTIKGMQKWVHMIGEPYFRLEPMEGVLEPSAVVALLSLVAVFRWRMYALGASSIPRDPFYDPEAALSALVTFQKNQGMQPIPYLSFSLLEHINAAHKTLKNESYKVHKAMLHRPEDYETETMSIDVFVRGIVSAGKDGPDSLRFVWTGKSRKDKKKDRDEEKETEGEGEDTSEHIGKKLRKRAGDMHALASGVVDEVKGGIKELSGLAKSRKGTDNLPTFKITQSDPEPEDVPRANRSGKSTFLVLSSASNSVSELERSRFSMLSPAKASSIKSFRTMITNSSTAPRGIRPVVRRTRTDARDVFVEGDEDNLSPVVCPRSPVEEVFAAAAAARCVKRRSSLSDIHAIYIEDIDARERLGRLEVDVALCGQFLELRDKETKMRHAISIAEVTLAAVQRTNMHLDRELLAHKQALATLVPKAAELQNVAHAHLAEANELSKNSEMLEYQLDRLEEGVKDMSRSVAGGRDRVRALRGAARRVGGVHGIEDDSEPEDEDTAGIDENIGSMLNMQSLSNIKKQFGSWLGTTKSKG
ncbi:Protein STB6 OS=Saccharomyces cerevisiae (strain ATCC 204508 / S288c) GN=STB6 PE=1 SV=1 [Rhizoctonia solani AG-1 IB]|uniref:Protein STB6 n=1 Tax=Thanatephorus cucumeris (strain AG1-IB / isolate 7/3/14) TaxID=1108050 RepID=A0A0B7FTK9_THACB|nr:Protein STB6 OS=Saccharomyces cerevisiae (strain ATCC 204508 / S288c) GN=STB6 PE=1 SV=1 [Rhizoctonia solani AG-1 IB]